MSLSPQSHEFRQIEKYIFRNNPKPGDRVATETEVMRKFRLTRYKVRQAFELFVQMGILERTQKRGTILKRVATNEMTQNILEQFKLASFDQEEFNESRIMIETAVIPFVIRRITPAQQSELLRLCALARNHANEPLKADTFLMDFHLLFLHICGNRVMEIFANVVRTYFRSTKHVIEQAPEKYFINWVNNAEELVKAIKFEDLKRAEEQLKKLLTTMPTDIKV